MCKSILTFAGLQLGNFASTRACEEFFQKIWIKDVTELHFSIIKTVARIALIEYKKICSKSVRVFFL